MTYLKLFLTLAGILYTTVLLAQKITVEVKDAESGEALYGATVQLIPANIGGSTDENGKLSLTIPPNIGGDQTLMASYIGYYPKKLKISLTGAVDAGYTLELVSTQMEDVLIEANRSDRNIQDIPTRVEVLTDELDESTLMDPAKIAHLLTHSTGVQVQQTSATSGAANVRIQGMDGKYAQILKDGFPLYGGLSSSLAILQLPPLDLKQVEYIKGSASTFYGSGAISGLINLVSKEPTMETPHETAIQLNASTIGAFDINAFTLHRLNKKLGVSVMASRNTQSAFDPENQGFANLPQLEKYNLNPKFFWFINDSTKLTIGGTFTNESRRGGDIKRILNETDGNDSLHFYLEQSLSQRQTSQLLLEHRRKGKHVYTIKNGLNFFERLMTQQYAPNFIAPEHRFDGRQFSSFSEASYGLRTIRHALTIGANLYTDQFRERRLSDTLKRNETVSTLGAFAGHTWKIREYLVLETGLRTDYNFRYGWFALPKVSLLIKYSANFSSRMGGGMGYRLPTLFNTESELYAFRGILAVEGSNLKPERSYNLHADVTFRAPIGVNSSLVWNQLFFYNYLSNPLQLVNLDNQVRFYENLNGHFESKGSESHIKLTVHDFVLFVGYTLTFADQVTDNGIRQAFAFTPRHSLKGDLLYALPGKWRVGIDYEYKSEQTLTDGRQVRGYVTTGIVIERTINNFVLYTNLENISNVRQTRYESIRSRPYDTPQLTDVWAPMDGFFFNAGIKIRL